MALAGLSAENAEGFFATLAPYKELIAEVLSHSDSVQNPVPWRPAPDAPAMAELAAEPQFVHPGDQAPVDGCFGKVALLMLAAEDHLDSLSGLFRPPAEVSVYTPAIVLRATLETLGRAHWLIDPAIEVKRRVGRNLTETLHQWFYRRKLFQGAERKAYDAEFGRDELLSWARGMKFEVEKDTDDCWYIGEPRPGSRKAIDRLFSGAAREAVPGTIFRSTSAVAHASLHGILSKVELEAGPGGPGSGNIAKVGTNDGEMREVLAVGLHAYVVVASARRQHMGWVAPTWDETVERVSQLLAATFASPSPPTRRPSGLHLP